MEIQLKKADDFLDLTKLDSSSIDNLEEHSFFLLPNKKNYSEKKPENNYDIYKIQKILHKLETLKDLKIKYESIIEKEEEISNAEIPIFDKLKKTMEKHFGRIFSNIFKGSAIKKFIEEVRKNSEAYNNIIKNFKKNLEENEEDTIEKVEEIYSKLYLKYESRKKKNNENKNNDTTIRTHAGRLFIFLLNEVAPDLDDENIKNAIKSSFNIQINLVKKDAKNKTGKDFIQDTNEYKEISSHDFINSNDDIKIFIATLFIFYDDVFSWDSDSAQYENKKSQKILTLIESEIQKYNKLLEKEINPNNDEMNFKDLLEEFLLKIIKA